MKIRKILLTVTCVIVAMLVAGCGGSRETASPPESQLKKPAVADRRLEFERDRAMQHFIDGAALDAKDQFAEAILEYQEALRFESNAAIHYAISKDYARLGKLLRASESAREAVRLDSLKIAYRENLASIYLALFQQELAIQEYEKIVRTDSNYTSGWYNLARLYQQSRPLKALEVYERLLDSDPDNWDILLQAAELWSGLGRFEKAGEYYRRMLEIDPSNRPLQRQLAETFRKAGKIDDAVRMLESMHEVDENDFEVTAMLGEAYFQRQQYDKAATLYQSLLKREQKNPEILLRIGVAYIGQIQHDSSYVGKAEEIFKNLKKETPNDFRVYWYLGMIASTQKKDSLAGIYFEKVTSLDEKNSEAWYFLGSNYFERNEFQRLLNTMERARKLFPNDARFYMLSGLAYSRMGQPEPAADMLAKSYRLNPKDVNTLGQLALTYDGMRKWKESDSLYEEALKIDAKSAIILNNYSYSLTERGLQLERALTMAAQAVEAEPDNASYLDTLGWVYFRLAKYQEAERYIAKAVATGGASAVVHEHLGDVCFKLGKKDKALEYWRQALTMDKENQGLKEKLERGSL